MKNFRSKQILSIILTSLIVLNQVVFLGTVKAEANELDPPSPIETYFPSDIEDHWATYVLSDFIDADILKGYQNSDETVSIKPNNKITRAEFLTLLVRATNLTSATTSNPFKDVKEGSWYSEAVGITASLGIVKGSEGNFYPNRNISRGELAAIIVRTFGTSISFEGEPLNFRDTSDSWAQADIAKASSVGIITGYEGDLFKPNANATRAEAMTMIHRALELENSSLPDDQMLIDTILLGENGTIDAINRQDFDSYKEISDSYTTGFYRSYQHNDADLAELLQAEGVTMSIAKLGHLSARVVAKSNRLAIIETFEAEYELTINDGSRVSVETIDQSGYVYLKKHVDGSWKVYSSDYLYTVDIFIPSN